MIEFKIGILGAGNIAGWIKDQINDKGLLDGAAKITV